MTSTMLVAVDQTERAPNVVAAAVKLAARLGARIFLYRIVTTPPDFPPAAATSPDDVAGLLIAENRTQLEHLAHGHPRIVIAPPELSALAPWHCIVAAAKRLDAELIVIGSHHYHGWDRLFGTTAAKVVDHADRNVLVVHAPTPDGSG